MPKPEFMGDEELNVTDTYIAASVDAPRIDSGTDLQPERSNLDDARLDLTAIPTSMRRSQLGDYLLGREIGRGGMGVVYEASEVSLRRRVAVKVLIRSSQMDKIQALRFANESRAAAQLSHPNIVPVYGVGEEDGVNYFVMRLIDGQNLSQLIKTVKYQLATDKNELPTVTPAPHNISTAEVGRASSPRDSQHHGSDPRKPERLAFSSTDFVRTRSDRKFASTRGTATKVAKIGVVVADALQHAHEAGILHRDIKPCNLMLDNEGVIWVTDFGLAQIKDTPTLTQTGVLMGTLRYMSPEQASGMRALVDQRTDIYSLGVSLCEMLTLQRVIPGKSTQEILKHVVDGAPFSIRRIDPSVPADLAVILEKAMSKAPQDRYSTAAEMADDMTRFLNNEPIHAKRPPLWKRCQQWAGRNRAIAMTLIGAFFATFLMTVAAAGVVWNALLQEQEQRSQTEVALTESEGLRLLANAALQLPDNPGLSLALAIEGAKAAPGLEADSTLMAAMDANHEYATVGLEVATGHVEISPDGRFAVTTPLHSLSRQRAAVLHSMEDGRTVRKLESVGRITSASFNPSGQYLITTSAVPNENDAGLSDEPVLWDVQTGQPTQTIEGASIRRTHSAMFSSASSEIVLSRGNEAVVYDYVAKTSELVLRGHGDVVSYAEFSPDGERILTISNDKTIRIWDRKTGKELRQPVTWDVLFAPQLKAAFTANSRQFAVCDKHGVRLFESEAANEDSVVPEFANLNQEMSVNRNGHQIAFFFGSSDEVTIVDSRTLSAIVRFRVPADVQDVVFSPINKEVFLVCQNQTFRYHSETGTQLAEYSGHERKITQISLNSSGGTMATVAADATLRLWHIDSGLVRSACPHPAADIDRILTPCQPVISGDGSQMAVASRQASITTLRQFNGQRLPGEFSGRSVRGEGRGGVLPTELLVTVEGRTVRVTEASTSRELYKGEFLAPVYSSTLLVDGGRSLLVRTGDGVTFVSLQSGTRLPVGRAGEAIASIAASSDGAIVLLGTATGRCVSLDPASGQELWSRQYSHPIRSLHISPDKSRYVVTDVMGNVQVIGYGEEDPICEFSVPANDRVEFLNDDSRILNWSEQECTVIECRNALNGEVVATTSGKGRIRLSKHPTDPRVAVGDVDGIRIWDIEKGDTVSITPQPCRALALCEDRIALVTGFAIRSDLTTPAQGQRQLLIYDLKGKNLLHQEDLLLSPRSLRVDHQNQILVLTELGFGLDICALNSCQRIYSTEYQPGPISFVRFLQRNHVVTVSVDGTARVSSADGATNKQFVVSENGVSAAMISPDEKLLIVGNAIGDVNIFDLTTGEQTGTLSGHEGMVRTLRFAGNGNSLVATSLKGPVHLWDLRTSRAVELKIPNAIHSEISPDGKSLLVIAGSSVRSRSKRVILIDTLSGLTTELAVETGAHEALFSPDGQNIGVLTPQGVIQVIDLQSLEITATIEYPISLALRFGFANSQTLLTEHESQINRWNISSGRMTRSFPNAAHKIAGVNVWEPVSFDDQWIYVNASSPRRLPINVGQHAQIETPRKLTKKERQRFRLDLVDVPHVSN